MQVLITVPEVATVATTVRVEVSSTDLGNFMYQLATEGRKALGPAGAGATHVDIISPGFTPGPWLLAWWEERGCFWVQKEREVDAGLADLELDEEAYADWLEAA